MLEPVTSALPERGPILVSRPSLISWHAPLSVVSAVHRGGIVSVTDSVTARPLWTTASRVAVCTRVSAVPKQALAREERAEHLPVVQRFREWRSRIRPCATALRGRRARHLFRR